MSSDIYGMQEPPAPSRRKRSATSQRRDEYLRAIGEEAAPHRHHHHHGHHRRSFRRKAVLYGLGVMALLAALGIIGSVLLATRNGLAAEGILPDKLLLNKTRAK